MRKINILALAIGAAVLALLTTPLKVEAVNNAGQKVVHVCKKSDTAVNILACNIYREARGESDYGMMSVAFVTLNRKDHEKFPRTVKKIVYQPGQFSWTTTGGTFKVYEKESWEKAKNFAGTLMKIHATNRIVYDALDITHGATYYHSKDIKPYWTKVLVRTVRIDNHVFYKEKSEQQRA